METYNFLFYLNFYLITLTLAFGIKPLIYTCYIHVTHALTDVIEIFAFIAKDGGFAMRGKRSPTSVWLALDQLTD